MDTGIPIIIKRGFFSTVAYGVSGVLITTIVCGSGLALYGMNLIDRKSGDLTSLSKELVAALPGILEALPPVLSDAVNDRRDPGYRSELDIKVVIAGDEDSSWRRPVLTVKNNGDEVVSLLAVRIVLLDEDGLPTSERGTYVATPLALENCEVWKGPILPGETRRISTNMYTDDSDVKVEIEVTEIRVWNGPAEGELAALADRD